MPSTDDVTLKKNRKNESGMTVEEALQVPWLSHNPKPLGELMDEGYLDPDRLKWAAERAYNPRLKRAAQILLDEQSEGSSADRAASGTSAALPLLRDVEISLEDAEATPWPFSKYRGEPMGSLVHSRALSLKDLGYAIENAWDERVRRAAMALSLVRLGQAIQEESPAAGPLNVITNSQRSFAQRRQLYFASLQGLVGGVVLGIAVMIAANTLFAGKPPGTAQMTFGDVLGSPEKTIALALVLLGTVAAYFLFMRVLDSLWGRLEHQIEAYRKGEAGEESVVERARRALDGNWTLFRNVVLPGKKGDLDIVLVGPPGVWAFEVKNMLGAYKNVGDSWAYRSGGKWRRMRKNPGRQARLAALALKNFLLTSGIKTYVHDVVVWAEPEAAVFQENPLVAVWRLDRLEDELGNLTNGRPLPEGDRAGIVEKLITLVE